MSDPLPILKGEIKRLGFVSNEKLSLLAHFTENVEKIAVAVSCLEDCDNDVEKRDYLRYLISQPEQPIGESERKRKAVEELTKTTSRRKQWIVNGAMREMDWYSKYWLDPMDDEQNKSLLKKITDGSFTGLYGARASGKSTRILRIINHLSKDYLCNYSSMEQINTNNNNNFWKTFGRALSIGSASRSFDSCTSIASADDFQEYFSIKSWSGDVNDRIILFIDEFDKLYQFDENIRSEFLQILRFIKNATHLFVIYAIVIVGTFSILHLDSETSSSRSNLVSPFNVKDLVHNPNFSSERVLALFTEFGNENKIKIEDEIIADIYTQTNGHAGLVCLCGRTIEDNLFSSINGDRILKYDVWERFKLNSLMDEIALYQTFRRMINSLLNTEARKAVNFFRDYFLVGDVEDEVSIVDTDSAEFLAAEGVLIPVARNRSTFKLSSPMTF
ncbi:P-loop containing nucleoside triphosphate hydrolase protein [Rhizophagus clarus]|uniref:P-loop containing nucleoside triphosphate hydrolase protein n=1 Tax=Rhizophagus clarus TaxID=94130 RepID=A0A8H3M6I0_9GLOM|nr:P-loop containing nucleoside triphosphate hydrolase protein [Rhizophagus clarus]